MPKPPPRFHKRPQRPEKPAPDRTTPEYGPDGLPQVSIVRRGVERWQGGHPWIYRADLNGDPALGGAKSSV
jgi:23S rRNA (cytosine1962-C5)-methyltransferase